MAELSIADQVLGLKKTLGDKATNMDYIIQKAKSENNRSLTADEQKDVNKLIDEQEAINTEIRTLERVEKSREMVKPEEKNQNQEKRGIEYADDPPYNIGEFFKDVALDALNKRSSSYRMPPRLELHQRKTVQEARAYTGMNETIPSEGGFLVGKDFSTEVFSKMHAPNSLLSRCKQATISSNANALEIPCIDETSRANGSRSGGVVAYWGSEGSTVTSTGKLKFGTINLALKKLHALAYCTEELLQDASYIQSSVIPAMQEEIQFMAQDALIRGDGAGKPLGILKAACLITVAVESGQGIADPLLAENILNMYMQMHIAGKQNFVWIVNDELLPSLVLLGSNKFPNTTFFVTAGGLVNSPTDTLLGKPVIYVEQATEMGSVGDIIAADFSQYQIASKGNIQTAMSSHVAFLTDEMVFKVTFRLDGQPLWKSALTQYKAKTATTRSPFVTLAARS